MVTESISEQAAVTQWPLRILLTLATLAVIVLLLRLLRRGWRNRQRGQGLELPPVPAQVADAGAVLTATSGSYLGTIRRGQLLERIIAGGGRAAADVVVGEFGVLIDRQGEPPLLIDRTAIEGVSTSPGMLQRYYGGHGVAMVDWRWQDQDVTSGLWFTDASDQALVLAQIRRLHLKGVT